MKQFAMGMVLCLALASVGYAQQSAADAPASKEDIQRYLDVMHTRDLLKDIMSVMTSQMHKTVHEMIEKQQGLPPDFEARMNKMMDDTFKDFPVDEYIQAVTPVYQKYLTKGDVDALVAFYKTPTGQKMIKEMPAMTAESMQAASGIIQKMVAKAMDRVQEEIAQVQKQNDEGSKKEPQKN